MHVKFRNFAADFNKFELLDFIIYWICNSDWLTQYVNVKFYIICESPESLVFVNYNLQRLISTYESSGPMIVSHFVLCNYGNQNWHWVEIELDWIQLYKVCLFFWFISGHFFNEHQWTSMIMNINKPFRYIIYNIDFPLNGKIEMEWNRAKHI